MPEFFRLRSYQDPSACPKPRPKISTTNLVKLLTYRNNSLNTSKVRESPVDVLEVDLSSPKGAAAVAWSKGIRIAKTTTVGIGES
jgi:hypothetical protein